MFLITIEVAKFVYRCITRKPKPDQTPRELTEQDIDQWDKAADQRWPDYLTDRGE